MIYSHVIIFNSTYKNDSYFLYKFYLTYHAHLRQLENPIIPFPLERFIPLEGGILSLEDKNEILSTLTTLSGPILCIFQVGEKNLDQGDTPQEVTDTYQILLEEIFKQVTNIHIFVMGLLPAYHKSNQKAYDECDQKICHMIEKFANGKVNFAKTILPSTGKSIYKGPYRITDEGIIQVIQNFIRILKRVESY